MRTFSENEFLEAHRKRIVAYKNHSSIWDASLCIYFKRKKETRKAS